MMNDWHDGGWGPGTWIAMALMMAAFWGVLAAVAIYAVRNLAHRSSDGPAGDGPGSALRILDERFARGEIEADEYHQRRELLRSR